MSVQRSHSSDTVTWTGMIGDLSLAVFKGAVGYFSGSKALLGDALYSASDAVSALNRLIPRFSSPKGRGAGKQQILAHRTEPVFAILFSVLVLMGGLQIAVASIREIASGKIHVPDNFALIAIFVSLAVKEAMFQFQYRYSKKQGDGQHSAYAEEHRFSLYTSLTVCVGVFLSVAGDTFGWKAMMYMDPVSALIVAGLVIRKGYLLIMNSVYGSLVQEAEQEDAINFIETVQRVHGIITVDDLKAREQGHYITVDLKISVNPRITVLEANEIADRAKKLLMHRFVHISDVNIQVVPYDPGYPYKSNHQLTDNDMPTLLQ
ncbi:cation diffusion facilitator family transporter [Paenibacillus dokdonensis]|uniref:Cation diffusion facilitator family transporter n=1 Tax=Paenibacillus dokdonensis TaxID=2567944 RepID=A0ABU6GNM2_9BACL|nr:cation diffusion facilitator family transporter [Paenibacillus dokdonensis]MEC0241340.1 cation diffusion facilitator family transporter [Paenibacillus dokdonensis]